VPYDPAPKTVTADCAVVIAYASAVACCS